MINLTATQVNQTKDAYNRLVRLIQDNGETYIKKHGNWCKLKLCNELWLTLDTWNRSIHVVSGECRYDNMWTGFADYQEEAYLGLDFGSFECHTTEHMLKYYYALAENNSHE